MSILRQNILRGPAAIAMSNTLYYTKGDIKLSLQLETFKIPTAIYGNVGDRLSDITLKLSFAPVGAWTLGNLATFFPRTAPIVGSSIFGATDKEVMLWPISGQERFKFTAGAITKMPGLKLSPIETAFKEMELTFLIKNGADRAAADALFTMDALTFPNTGFDVDEILTVPYTSSLFGLAAPWDAIESEDGFDVDINETLAPVTVANTGIVDMSHAGLEVSVKFKPVGISVSDVLAQMTVQGTGVKRGMDLARGAQFLNLTISGGTGNPKVIVNNVRLKSAPSIYGNESLRHDVLEFVSSRPTGIGQVFSVGIAS